MIGGPGSARQSIIPHLGNGLPAHHSTLSESMCAREIIHLLHYLLYRSCVRSEMSESSMDGHAFNVLLVFHFERNGYNAAGTHNK